MTQSQIRLANVLTYAGTLPLIVALILVFFPFISISPQVLAKTYSAVIIAFLCGIHWAIYLFFANKVKINLLLMSNIFSLCAWASLFLRPDAITLGFQALCFATLFMLDINLNKSEIFPHWFYILRRNATMIVVVSLVLLAFMSQ